MDQIRSIGDSVEDLVAGEMGPGVKNLVNGPVGGELSQDLLDGEAWLGTGRLVAPPHRVCYDAWGRYGIGGIGWSRHRSPDCPSS
jgi:hypothetical protein